ncbi:uncharacterized protein FFUJ_13413 [Fusarium fujikuroi IMI 58289]|uniref:Uncharacterized protein n=1 Tax=Gibberella fujikuroi (strain CBS 195.34 / IMI 58289 / NRRL A-6831) TaxID=1279085 RepID=S0E3D3_GIBF5|nr:uncharacterized protein FFUJ_13413 [Fusarium fujikuroi IMI 58289]KLP18651.1 uncharacterized protein LW94_580 [Fusarium fujikuroi]QGI63253.1 hypothetical protein CEK27_007224 [Fusarium fujikuroi]QGI80420.1 hypothetical protein CEK25_007149 [Fusarium fujikuroi]QGI80533.1 hypothetical protein CEK25_007262 [Fusarium fujikuroi]QGI94136.1 hypothetical protein CEK26_007205 [Fusarium fujikuroi]
MLDTHDEPHQVPVHGIYFDKVWIVGNAGSKVTNGDMRIIRKYVRASRLFIPRDGAKHMPDCLPVEIPVPESATPAVYVGISWVAIQHVFMRDKTKVNKVSFGGNTESFDLRAEPSNVVAEINTIFHEECTSYADNGGLYQYAPAIPRDCFWNPFQRGILVSLTGDAQTIGPVWKQMKGVEAEVPFDQSLKLSSQSWTEHVQNLSIANAASEEFRSHLETRNNMRVKLALQLGKKLKDLVYDREQVVFKWDGMIHVSLPNEGDIEPLTTDGAATQENTVDSKEPPVSPDEPIDSKN